MKKISTPFNELKNREQSTSATSDSLPGPTQQTLAFLKQFARAYYREQKLSENLSVIIVN